MATTDPTPCTGRLSGASFARARWVRERLYNQLRTHLSLGKDSPSHRPVQRLGQVTAPPVLGGLHHHYRRI